MCISKVLFGLDLLIIYNIMYEYSKGKPKYIMNTQYMNGLDEKSISPLGNSIHSAQALQMITFLFSLCVIIKHI